MSQPTTESLRQDILDSFDRRVNAVDDLGWNHTASAPVDPDFGFDEGTLIELPPGIYRFDDTQTAHDLHRWGIRGLGDEPGDVRLRVPNGQADRILNVRDHSENVLIENLTFDHGDDWPGSIGNVVQVADNGLIKDVEYAGKNPANGVSMLNVYVLDPDGVLVIDGLTRKGPTELVEYPANEMALFCGPESVGTLYVRNSHLENCGSTGIYASRCQGGVRVENSTFKNNQNTQVRVSGSNSWVKDSTFIWHPDHPNRGSFQSATGLVWESGFRGYAGGLVENCDFICEADYPNSGCLKVDGSHGGLTVRDSRIYVGPDVDAPAINAEAPGDSHMIDGSPSEPWPIELDTVHVIHEGGQLHDHDAAVAIHGRPDSELDGVCINSASGSIPHAIRADGGSVHVTDSAIEGETTGDLTGGWARTADCERATTDSPPMDSYAHMAVVSAGPDVVSEYAFEATGPIALVTEGPNAAVPAGPDGKGETVTEQPDGTYQATGIVAGGGADTFEFDGEITAFDPDEPGLTLTVDGEEWVPPVPDPEPEPTPTREELLQFRDVVRSALKGLEDA